MSKTKPRWLPCALMASLALPLAAQMPVDQLRSDYRNHVLPMEAGQADWPVQLGVGNGFEDQWSVDKLGNPLARSRIGSPVSFVSANRTLGERVEPPADWTGEEPQVEPMGGNAVWIPYAGDKGELLTLESGPVNVTWPVGSGEKTETIVISPSPNKRPVRFYWTHCRPNVSDPDKTLRQLQNAGPTVTFGQNYKVEIYETGKIGRYDPYDQESQANYDPSRGYVVLDGNELKALEGTYGTFLLVYSRVDEALNRKVMLAHELVEVMEPKQTRIDVKIGDQLKPQTRNFDTEELFASVQRGLADEAGNDEIYLYQHGAGAQKNFLWAIRDSSAAPWKIEIFWRAKEELDVVWPFECDIYAASWDEEGAQCFVRDTEDESGGEAKIEPVVYYPSGVTVEAMDYQVGYDVMTGTKERKHFHIADGKFYSDWADTATYALLKYTSGDSVWFQTVRSVPAKSKELVAKACGEVYVPPYVPPPGTSVIITPEDPFEHVPLAGEIVSPFTNEVGVAYPGWIRREHENIAANSYPVKNPYNPKLYNYPTAFVEAEDAKSAIFAVNMGELEVWWSKVSNLTGEPRPNSGATGPLRANIHFPVKPVVYRVETPEHYVAAYTDTNKAVEPDLPQIVIASGKGSAGEGLSDFGGPYGAPVWSRTMCWRPRAGIPVTLGRTVLHGRNNGSGVTSNFTFEAWVSRNHAYDGYRECPFVSFYAKNAETGETEATPHLRIGFDGAGNFYLNGEKKTAFTKLEDGFAAFGSAYRAQGYDDYYGGLHVALTHDGDGTWRYYLNNRLAGAWTGLPDAIDVGGDEATVFESSDTGFSGCIQYLRLWNVVRGRPELDELRYEKVPASDSLVFQYWCGDQEYDIDTIRINEGLGSVSNGRLIDSSGHGADCRFAFNATEDYDTTYWMTAGLQKLPMALPLAGRTFPTSATIYRQPDREQDGYNPNEEHAMMVGSVAYALRCDLNRVRIDGGAGEEFTSLPYVLVQYVEADTGKTKMCALRVVPENDRYRFRKYLEAGNMIQSPAPLSRMVPSNLQKFISGPLYAGLDTCYRDRNGYFWAHQAADDGGVADYVFEFSYPNQEAFDWTDGSSHDVGESVPWMAGYAQRDDWFVHTSDASQANGLYVFPARDTERDPAATGIDYTIAVDWPKEVAELSINDTLHEAKSGGVVPLPAIRGQKSVLLAYQQAVALGGEKSVQLVDPTVMQTGSMPDGIPEKIRNYVDVKSSCRRFTDLPPYVRTRLVWNPNAVYDRTAGDTRELELTGKYISDGELKYAWLNVMDAHTLAALKNADVVPGADDAAWQAALDTVPREPVTIDDDITPFDSIALQTTGRSCGYVTLVFNSSTNLSMVQKSDVITMKVIRVVPRLYAGSLHYIQSDNPLDKMVNFKYSSDFAGKPEDWEFQWQYCDVTDGRSSGNWLAFVDPSGEASDWITFGDAGVLGLYDHYVRCRYRPRATNAAAIALVGDSWSAWSQEQYQEGWIKRVLKAINPFDQRIRDLLNNKLNTQLTMIQQAGKPYEGDIPLNLEALDACGLIEIYETILREAKKLSIEVGEQAIGDPLALSLQMAAGRIAELYTILGNEAYADALNPTVDLGDASGVDDTAEGSVFPFMNQCGTLLDEELCLLRGRDLRVDYAKSAADRNGKPWATPCYNRLQWNFTADIAGGQVAYVENYGIRDVCGASTADDPSAKDGIIDVYDAQSLYPQGHGDAWGHYLSALKGYYALLRHPNFGWKPQLEGIVAGQNNITLGYLHEKRFAQAAEMKAKTGEKIVADTYRACYEAGKADPWLDAEDETESWSVGDEDGRERTFARAWGVDEWATRAHLGAYYDWATVNAILPDRETREGLVRILDRESTKEIGALAASARRIQSTADHSDAGMNPLGLADSAIPFDISPSEIDAGKTHFEQIYARAVRATKVAKDVFDRVKGVSNRLRDQNASSDFEKTVNEEEAAINRRLVEIYGYPYADDIGPGKTYPQGYQGPDTEHYHYIETYDLDGSGGINGAYRDAQSGDGSYGRYIDVTVDDYKLITTNVTGTFQAEIDKSLADNGFLGNLIVGAVSWYQDKLSDAGDILDPWTRYAGFTSDDFKLPVAVVDTGADNVDGKVDYTFTIAAWSNTPRIVSYFVGENGFTPKPPDFHGQRKAEGECQIALNGYAALLAEIDVAATKLLAANEKLQGLIDELGSLDYVTQMGYVEDAAKKEVEAYIAACKKNAETVKTTLEKLKELKNTLMESGVEAVPKVEGLSNDFLSAVRAALLAVQGGLEDVLNGDINIQKLNIQKAEKAVEELEDTLGKQYKAWMDNAERKQKVAAIKEQTAVVKTCLAELEVTFNNANEKRMNYAKIVAEGRELQIERERLRIQWAADLSQSRYRNMTFQIMRNDELVRYNEAFELAAKYVFLAAKAYDYETGMLRSDSDNLAGSAFMTEIVRSRALGRMTSDGTPLGGGAEGDPGLADVLYRLGANWSVLKGRLGFNNPQNDCDAFSLRRDLKGKSLAAEGDGAWRDALAACWTDDLRAHPAFARLCQPFDPMRAVEPGFVIPFRTVIAARRDLFGNDLAGGSTAYSSTYFATKLRGVGVWFETRDGASLPIRPEVYLVPAGLDYMRVPIRASNSSQTTSRTWQVVDQVLPMPYELADSHWEATDWSALKDICGNELCVQRRHPAIRAYAGESCAVDNELRTNARLIGRSVWNDQWYLIVPAAAIGVDDASAKAAVLDAVRDIHLYLKTYSFSGN